MIPIWLTDTVTSNLDRAIHYTLLWGLDGVELRTVGTPSNRVPFVNEEKLRRRLREHELPVAAVVPGMFEGRENDRSEWMNEIAALDDVLQFCRRIECPRIITSAFAPGLHLEDPGRAVEALRMAGRAAASYGVTISVLNESDMARQNARALASLLEEIDHPSVRAAWNPAEALKAGEEAFSGLAVILPHLDFIRCTDVLRTPAGAFAYAPVGQGDVGWPILLQQLHDFGYAGPLSLEVHLDPKAKHGLYDATQLIQLIRMVQRRETDAVQST